MRCPWPSVPSAFAVLRPSSNFVVVLQFSGTFNRDGPEHTDTPTHRQTQTMSREPANIHGILNTLLVPMEPPNRSQWKKLELAMKFIHLSKQSVVRRKSSQVFHKEKRNFLLAVKIYLKNNFWE